MSSWGQPYLFCLCWRLHVQQCINCVLWPAPVKSPHRRRHLHRRSVRAFLCTADSVHQLRPAISEGVSSLVPTLLTGAVKWTTVNTPAPCARKKTECHDTFKFQKWWVDPVSSVVWGFLPARVAMTAGLRFRCLPNDAVLHGQRDGVYCNWHFKHHQLLACWRLRKRLWNSSTPSPWTTTVDRDWLDWLLSHGVLSKWQPQTFLRYVTDKPVLCIWWNRCTQRTVVRRYSNLSRHKV